MPRKRTKEQVHKKRMLNKKRLHLEEDEIISADDSIEQELGEMKDYVGRKET